MNLALQNDTLPYTRRLRGRMRELVDQLRDDMTKVKEPQARAMFETTAEVLAGLAKAFDDYEKKAEPAWRDQPEPVLQKQHSHAAFLKYFGP